MKPNPSSWYCKIHGILIYWRRVKTPGMAAPMHNGNNYLCRACNGQPYPQAHNWKQRMKR